MENGVNPEAGNSSLSLDQAAEVFAPMFNGDEPEKKEAPQPEREAREPEQANEADAPDQVLEDKTEQDAPEAEADAETEGNEPEQSDDEEAETDQPEEPQTLIRLKDGTEVTLEEVEKGFLRDADYRRKTMEIADTRKALQAREAEIAQKSQYFEQNVNFAIELAKAHMPQEPDPSLINSDPIGYMQQKADYDARIVQLRQLFEAKQVAEQERTAESQRATMEALKHEAEALMTALPELKDPAKGKQFIAEVSEAARQYGFTDQDVSSNRDHRLFLMARDAAAYRKLMANKPKAQAKAKDAPPVQKPGVRTSQSATKDRVSKDKWARLQKTGSIEDGAAVLLDMVKG